MVAIIQQRTWTNGKARNHLGSLQSLRMQLCALEAHIRISRNLKIFVELMRNHIPGPEPSPYPLQGVSSNGANRPKLQTWLNVAPFGQPGIGG